MIATVAATRRGMLLTIRVDVRRKHWAAPAVPVCLCVSQQTEFKGAASFVVPSPTRENDPLPWGERVGLRSDLERRDVTVCSGFERFRIWTGCGQTVRKTVGGAYPAHQGLVHFVTSCVWRASVMQGTNAPLHDTALIGRCYSNN